MGVITLIVFPIPTFIVLYFIEGIHPLDVLDFEHFQFLPILYGTIAGLLYAGLSLLFMQAKVFDKLPTRIESLVKQMNLSVFDCIFLSICAGVGEELLFRSGVQFYLGPILTSIFFVAIHGYLNPMNWRMSLYGIIVLPFIFIISYGFIYYGLWFSIFAHFTYDLILFLMISQQKEKNIKHEWTDWDKIEEKIDFEEGCDCEIDSDAPLNS